MLVDTSVWSLALRRDALPDVVEVDALRDALSGQELVLTTGVILQELLQGAVRPASREAIVDRFRALQLIVPTREDHVAAAEIRHTCQRKGVQLGTIDALIASLCIQRRLALLTTDVDFRQAARHVPLTVWSR